MAANDFYKLVTKIFDGDQYYQNRFWYRHTTGTGDASDLVVAWLTDVWSVLQPIIHQDADLIDVTAYNLMAGSEADQVIIPVNEPGTNIGSKQPNHVALSIKLQPTNTSLKAGGKRFGPITETFTDGNQPAGTAATLVTNLLNALTQQIDDTAGNQFKQQCARVVAENPFTGTFSAVLTSTVLGITSQNSRKFYRN